MRTVISLNEQHALEAALAIGKSLGNFTLACWLKTSGHGPLFFHHANGTFFSVEIATDGRVTASAGTAKASQQIQSARGGINDAEWHHLAIVSDAGQLSLLVDAEPVVIQALKAPATPKITVEGVWVGKDPSGKQFLTADVGDVMVWDRALSPAELVPYKYDSPTGNEVGLAMSALFGKPSAKAKLEAEVESAALDSEKATITIKNDSPFEFKLDSIGEGNVSDQLPKVLLAGKETKFVLTPGISTINMKAVGVYKPSTNPPVNSDFSLEILKSATTPYNSYMKATVGPGLERDIAVPLSTVHNFNATLQLSLNLVIVNAMQVLGFVEYMRKAIGKEKVLTNMNYDHKTATIASTDKQMVIYYEACQLFNRRIQELPSAIVLCTSEKEVQLAYQKAVESKLPISVRSGGHDHEGESSGTNTILIDMMGVNGVSYGTQKGKPTIAKIASGNRFITLTTELANHSVMIPHGTCATVALPGFIMGGGWGPWTRKMGMCCERLVGAKIVLGDGKPVDANADKNPELLWALKGGGGMSYGIVTEFQVETFPLPQELIKFELEWNPYDRKTLEPAQVYPTIQVLQAWENVISTVYKTSDSPTNPNNLPEPPAKPNASQLNGTNLKINGKPLKVEKVNPDGTVVYEKFDADEVKHNCVMYGYWEGNERHLREFIDQVFTKKGLKPADIRIDGVGGLGDKYGEQLMGSWDRESFINVQRMEDGKPGLPFPPDLDEPAPHKITSRLVEKQGLGKEGYQALLESLTSPLIMEGNRRQGLFQYVTLGAIIGDFYANMPEDKKTLSAFPYKDRLYTIQYQTWWNTDLKRKLLLENNDVYVHSNRALDWMEASRDWVIPNTSGAFISFKDNSIPTKTYFGDSYDRLVEIKKDFSKDTYNHLRSRKTII